MKPADESMNHVICENDYEYSTMIATKYDDFGRDQWFFLVDGAISSYDYHTILRHMAWSQDRVWRSGQGWASFSTHHFLLGE